MKLYMSWPIKMAQTVVGFATMAIMNVLASFGPSTIITKTGHITEFGTFTPFEALTVWVILGIISWLVFIWLVVEEPPKSERRN